MPKPNKQFSYPDNQAIDKDMATLYSWVSRLEVVTVNPDGSRKGIKGDVVLLITGGKYYVEANVDSGVVWRGIELQNVP